MKQPEVVIRILDLDGDQLGRVEREMIRGLRRHDIVGKVICIGCGLEIARQGFSNAMPALLMNEYVISEGTPITPEVIETFLKQLLVWLERERTRLAEHAA